MREPNYSLNDVQLGFVETFEDACEFMRWASEHHDVLAVDTETTGFSAYEPGAHIRLIQIGDEKTGWAIPFQRYGGLAYEILKNFNGPIVWHNAAFDLKFLAVCAPDFPLRWDRAQDTMIIARLAEPSKSAALKRLTDELFDRRASLGQKALAESMDVNKWTWATVPLDLPVYWQYAALDVVLTARLWQHFQPWVAAHRSVYDVEMQVRRICTQMELKGFRIDLPYVSAKKAQLEGFINEAKKKVKDDYGFSLGSPIQLATWILSNGGEIHEFTPSGKPQTSKDVLDRLVAETATPTVVRQVAALALQARRADKIVGTYLSNFEKEASDGIIHANINTLAARTGRMSITQPALQTLHRNDTAVRDAFIPRFDGEVLVTCDSDQIEARLFANFSGDKAFQAAFDTEDFFVDLARTVYDDLTLVKSDKRRNTIKAYMYSKLYGAGVAKQALTAGVPFEVMKAVDNRMNAAYPGMKIFTDAVVSAAYDTGKVVTPTGRELVIDSSDRSYTATNYLIQGHAAEVLKQSIINLDNAGLGEYLTCPVHDEVLASVPKEMAEDAKRTMEECMTATGDDYPVPLTASAEGPFERWGDKLRK